MKTALATLFVLAAVAVLPATASATRYCTDINGIKFCRTPGKTKDKICTTVHLNGITVTHCHYQKHKKKH